MRKIAIVTLAALTTISLDCALHKVLGGELSFRAHPHKCGRHDYCGFPVACPSGACYALYGSYGPYGGPSYWSRYTYGGWHYP